MRAAAQPRAPLRSHAPMFFIILGMKNPMNTVNSIISAIGLRNSEKMLYDSRFCTAAG